VAVVDLKAGKVISRWPVAPGGVPVGMSMDAKKRLLIIGCRGPQKLIAMSMDDGKVVSAVPIGEGVDATQIEGDEIFASCRDGSLTVAREASAGKFEVSQVLKTRSGSGTLALDHDSQNLSTCRRNASPETRSKGTIGTKAGQFHDHRGRK